MASFRHILLLSIVISISYSNAYDFFGLQVDKNNNDILSSMSDSAGRIASETATRGVDDILDKTSQTNFLTSYYEGLTSPEIFYDFKQLVDAAGYEAEEHTVITEDGYVLTVFRIPGEGPPVFLQHGLMNSADDWVGGGIDSALPYFLVEDGYDVWFGNCRGNKHSRKHIHMSPVSPEFWDFSWHEIGIYDLPAMIDYVLEYTSKDKLSYIGHSQGTTSYAIMQAERPEYNEKVNVGIMLSLVAYMTHIKSPLVKLLVPYLDVVYALLKDLGIYEIAPNNILTQMFQDVFCDSNMIMNLVCTTACYSTFGFDFEQMNPARMPIFLSHTPSSSSVRQLVHYGQGMRDTYFRQFDWGVAKNLKVYGNEIPPNYHIENITSPLAILYSDGDWFSNTTDVEKFMKRAPNVVEHYKIPNEYFNHEDFVWAKDIKTLEYPKIKELIETYCET